MQDRIHSHEAKLEVNQYFQHLQHLTLEVRIRLVGQERLHIHFYHGRKSQDVDQEKNCNLNQGVMGVEPPTFHPTKDERHVDCKLKSQEERKAQCIVLQ